MRDMGMTGVTIKVGLYVVIIFVCHNNLDTFELRLVFGSSVITMGSSEVSFVVGGLRWGSFYASFYWSTLFRKPVISISSIGGVILHLDVFIVEVLTGLIVCSRYFVMENVRCGTILLGWFLIRFWVVFSGKKVMRELILFFPLRWINPVAFCQDLCWMFGRICRSTTNSSDACFRAEPLKPKGLYCSSN